VKVMTVVGTRPEIIRLSRVIARLGEMSNHVLVHTGQNWDKELSDIFFEEMQITTPKYFLNVQRDSLGSTIGGILEGVERCIEIENPDAFLVLGDTNSALSLIIAKRLHVPTYHMEAGNRCFDLNVPEETNRKIVDHTSDFNLVYTEHARRNLLREGLHPRAITLTGSPMYEVLTHYLNAINSSEVLTKLDLKARDFFLVSLHREETVDSPKRLSALLDTLMELSNLYGKEIIVSTHPRTRLRLEGIETGELSSNIKFMKPFGFFDYNKLQKEALCVLSDSGTISEESAILGFPAVTLRASIERPEALDTASIMLADINPAEVVAAVEIVTNYTGTTSIPVEYLIENTSERVVRFIQSTHHLHEFWFGLR